MFARRAWRLRFHSFLSSALVVVATSFAFAAGPAPLSATGTEAATALSSANPAAAFQQAGWRFQPGQDVGSWLAYKPDGTGHMRVVRFDHGNPALNPEWSGSKDHFHNERVPNNQFERYMSQRGMQADTFDANGERITGNDGAARERAHIRARPEQAEASRNLPEDLGRDLLRQRDARANEALRAADRLRAQQRALPPNQRSTMQQAVDDAVALARETARSAADTREAARAARATARATARPAPCRAPPSVPQPEGPAAGAPAERAAAAPAAPEAAVARTGGSNGAPVSETAGNGPAAGTGGTGAAPGNAAGGGFAQRAGFVWEGGPSVRTQLGMGGAGLGLTAVASGLGRVVEHETGNPYLGMGTGMSIGVGGSAAMARLAGAPVARSVGGGLLTSIGGEAARRTTIAVTGNQTAGDVTGYATAGAIGAGFGGPIGAGVAVTGMAVADGVSAGVDYYYAGREGERLDQIRARQEVYRNFAAVQGRNLNNETLGNMAFWERMARESGGGDRMREMLARGAGGRIGEQFQRQLGRAPTPEESAAFQNNLARGGWLQHGEQNLQFTRDAYRSILGRDPDAAGVISNTNALANGSERGTMLRSLAASEEAGTRITDVYRQAAGRAPTAAEMQAARDTLGRGEGLRAVLTRAGGR